MTGPSAPVAAPRLSLALATKSFILIAFFIVATVTAAVVWNRSDRLVTQALDEAVRVRTSAAGQVFARTLYSDWRDLRFLAGAIGRTDSNGIRDMMAGLRGDGSRISWVGYATVDGTVREASDGLLVGVDVSQRPWFRNGLNGGFAGDVHDAVLLAKKLRPEGGDPLRFIDLALPVRDPSGTLQGVVGMHIDAAWVDTTVEETGKMLGIDLFLINQMGEVIMAPGTAAPSAEEMGLLRAARVGATATERATWPDGKTYFTTLVPSIAYGDLPSFGWRLAGRIDAASYAPVLSALRQAELTAAGVALVLIALMTAVFARIFLSPIEGLAFTADRIARGIVEYSRPSGPCCPAGAYNGPSVRHRNRAASRGSCRRRRSPPCSGGAAISNRRWCAPAPHGLRCKWRSGSRPEVPLVS